MNKNVHLPDYIHLGRASDFAGNERDERLRRFLEMLPGILSWSTLIGVFLGSFLFPQFIALFIIAFDTYWIINGVYFAVFIIRNTILMKRSLKTDWLEKLDALPQEQYRVPVKHWSDVIHLVVFPMVYESVDVVGSAIGALAKSDYPNEKIFIVLATEERAGEKAQKVAGELERRYAKRFGKFMVTVHPSDTAGEIAGKGSNQAYAGRKALIKLIDEAKIEHERVLVSSFDADTRVFEKYFSCLTYHFLTAEKPQRTSYQPIPLYNNNIWEAPLFSRIPAIGSSAWQIFMQSQPKMQETFSSHSMPLTALVAVDFWHKSLVSEDSIIYWQCFLTFHGDYHMMPLYYPVSMDANIAGSTWQTLKSVYKQHRRWAYGIEKIPYVIFGFVKDKRIPLVKKIARSSKLIMGFWLWATASFLLLGLGWLPVVLGGEVFRNTVIAYGLPRWTRNLMTFAMIGLLVNGALTFTLLPPRPKGRSRWIYVSILLQWLFLPLSTILFGAVPALDAQTRMLFKRYLGFFYTEKARKRPSKNSPLNRED